jgi:hypothetical protein
MKMAASRPACYGAMFRDQIRERVHTWLKVAVEDATS